MKVLHICNDFSGSRVHSELIRALDQAGIEQAIYNPVRDPSQVSRNTFEAKHTEFFSINNIKPLFRLLYHLKASRLYGDLKALISVKEMDICHASTLFSDGYLAYKLNREFGIPYVVAVRSTDVNVFMRKAPYSWAVGRRILISAKKIIFISPSLKEKFCSSRVFHSILPEIREKFVIQPNGIDAFWLDNRPVRKESDDDTVLYVGKFIPRKNAYLLEKAVVGLKKEFPNIKLTLVGGGGEDEQKVLSYAKLHSDCIKYMGLINDPVHLSSVYRANSIFAMPSTRETFGLVFFEAFSQDLAVLYVKGEGVDGLLPPEAGERVETITQEEVEGKLREMIRNRTHYSNQTFDFKSLRWENIANNYIRIYENSI